jgi:very-short-patch-repair endonuclease
MTKTLQPWAQGAWRLVRRQHGVVARTQLLELGMPPVAIRRRLESGRLHRLHRGVYAVGRPEVGTFGHLMAAVLACGPDAQLSHRSGAALWRISRQEAGLVDVSVPSGTVRNRRGVRLHRRTLPTRRFVRGIPVGDPLSILIDLATCLGDEGLEDAVNAADHLNLIATPALRTALDAVPTRPGIGRLRRLLDAQTFSRSQTALERRFLPIARAAGLPAPGSQVRLGRYRVDFLWPELGLVVEADSLRYHRTAAEQTTDLERDQSHTRAGLRTLRFTHSQVFHRPAHVQAVLVDTVRNLGRSPTPGGESSLG